MRLEYKYLIPVSDLQKIKNKMAPYLVLDKYAAKNKSKDYTVRSLYFDNPKLQYYFEKVEGIKVRKKIRIRVYDNFIDGSIAFLEIKRKNEDYVCKYRAPLLYRDLNKFFETREVKDLIISNGSNRSAIENAKLFLFYYIHDNLQPVSLIAYDREPFFSKFDNGLRITFDKNLRFLSLSDYNNIFEEKKLSQALNNRVIIEIKFNHSIPAWLRDIIIQFRLYRMALSKYVICMNANNENNFGRHKKIALSNLDICHSSIQNKRLKLNV